MKPIVYRLSLCLSVFPQSGRHRGGTLRLLLQRHTAALAAAGRHYQDLLQDVRRVVEGRSWWQGGFYYSSFLLYTLLDLTFILCNLWSDPLLCQIEFFQRI